MVAGDLMLLTQTKNAGAALGFRSFFKTRDFFLHDGSSLRRIRVGLKTQVAAAAAAAILFCGSAVGVTQMTGMGAETAAAATGSSDAEVARMQSKVAAMRADMEAVKRAAAVHAMQMERRQAFLAAVLAGEDDPKKLAALLPQEVGTPDGTAASVVAPLQTVAGEQGALAEQVRAATEARYKNTARLIQKLGLSPQRFHVSPGAMGGPFEPVDAAAAKAAEGDTDAQFKALFLSWKKLDQLEQGVIAIPSQKPVDNVKFTSSFGVRSDPFRGTAAMHSGVDIPGSHGSAIYATADGIVGRAGWAGGYGNLVEIEHGKGIQTRYGHLSKVLVAPNTRVKRGQLIALMGSTGRSTGCHLHYEVRIDGRAVNPIPFMQQSEYLADVQQHSDTAKVALGGPLNN